jgi:tRNA dimethylallyltransferase
VVADPVAREPAGDADAPPDAVLLAGPTASGKSDWALRLAAVLPVEIVSVDASQVYRGLDIGTAKPGTETRRQVPHHLLDIRDPSERYSAGEFAADARRLIGEIRARGALPVLVGGTLLYFRALVAGIVRLPPVDPAVRRGIDARAEQLGWPALHAELRDVDPAAAARIHPNDPQRIQRGLEVYQSTGRPLSDWHRDTEPGHALHLERWALVPGDRAALHARIATRCDAMLERGWLDEVQALRARQDLDPSMQALRAVGYGVLWAHLDGRLTLAQARERAIAATRQLAKRQLTWLRRDSGWRHIDPDTVRACDSWVRALRGRLPQRGRTLQ